MFGEFLWVGAGLLKGVLEAHYLGWCKQADVYSSWSINWRRGVKIKQA